MYMYNYTKNLICSYLLISIETAWKRYDLSTTYDLYTDLNTNGQTENVERRKVWKVLNQNNSINFQLLISI